MTPNFIIAIADSLGLTVEVEFLPAGEKRLRVYKGAKLIFVGSAPAVEKFLNRYSPAPPPIYRPLEINENSYKD
jgi:hypothetical protein